MATKESYYIYKKYNNNKSMIGIINNPNKFLKFVELDIKNMNNIKNYFYVDDEIEKFNNQMGFFLVKINKFKLNLVRQYGIIEKGLCFDSIINKTQIIASWTLLLDNYNKLISNEVNYINELKYFCIEDMCENFNMLIIDENIEKEQLIQDIINQNKNEQNKIISISSYDELDFGKLNDLMKYQITEKCKNKMYIVLDNCIVDVEETFNNEIFRKLFQDGKYYNINLIICIKFPVLHMQHNKFDYVVLYENNNSTVKEKIYEQYAKFIESYNEFNTIFTKYIVRNNALIISNKYDIYTGLDRLLLYIPTIEL
jgi:hypothetical protein